MPAEPKMLRVYSTAGGREPFHEWIDALRDYSARAKILIRLERVRLGSLGDWKLVGEGVCELRIDAGPGYRVYFGRDGESIVLLLCGGHKGSQHKDIANAKQYWKDYKSRKAVTERTI